MANRELMINGIIAPQFLPAGGGGGGADWSTYPAIEAVNMDQYDLNAVGNCNVKKLAGT